MTSLGRALLNLIEREGGRSDGGVRKSYNRKSWSAQYRHMGKTKAGRDALARLGVTDRTRKAWEKGERQPSPANQAKIADLYQGLGGVFPASLRSRTTLTYTGPSPWASDPRTPGSGSPALKLGLGAGLDWDEIADKYEEGELDEDTAEDLAWEGLFRHDLGSTSPPNSYGGGCSLE